MNLFTIRPVQPTGPVQFLQPCYILRSITVRSKSLCSSTDRSLVNRSSPSRFTGLAMDFVELKNAIDSIGLVDGHAHNIVALDSCSLAASLSEATGDALSFAPHSLSFKRNLRKIAELYGTENSLDAIEEYRRSSGLQAITSKCFEAAGISALFIDDGLQLDKMHGLEWHKNHVSFVGRILRIERLAEEILDSLPPDRSDWNLKSFTESFTKSLKSVSKDIMGLKTIAAYRSGLEINPHVTFVDAEDGLLQVLHAGYPVRVTDKRLIDYIFMLSLEVAQSFDLPIQIHTGFGDKDLDLRLSNPLHLRSLLEDDRCFRCRFVLLHASYPFSKEASYLASVYPQVFLDFGLAVPKLSVHGMISSIKGLLELAPVKKVMFSTDGYATPETHYLGSVIARDVLFCVLRDACLDHDISVVEAIEAAKDIFQRNAIQFYKISLSDESVCLKARVSHKTSTDQSILDQVVSLVRIMWVDASGQHRCRVVPMKRFNDVVKKSGVGLTFASMGMCSYVDSPAPETNLSGTGEIRLMPDLSTKFRIPWTRNEEMVLADMHIKPGQAWDYCPKEALKRVTKILKDEFGMVMNAGFENEFYLLRKMTSDGKDQWLPIDFTPYCSTSAFDTVSMLFHEIVASLNAINIPVEQLHAEAGKGQFEIALGHCACTDAANRLIFTHEVIRSVARKHGLLATFVPKYALDDIGSGSHVHLSLWKNGQNVFMASGGSPLYGMSDVGEMFMAGVLEHLPSLLAFTAPLPNSYDRIQPNTWSGAYLCWGKENREAPLRTSCPPGIQDGLVSNFEIKSFDGCANPYLGLAAIAAAGIDGLRRHLSLPEPVDINPDSFKGKLQRLPKSLSESLEALQKDRVLHDLIGEKLLGAIKGVRKAEVAYYDKNKEAYKQLIHRY